MIVRTLALAAAGAAALAGQAVAQAVVTRKTLSAEAAKAAVAGCEAYARKQGWAMTISVVDADGAPMAFLRMDDTPKPTIMFANGKAQAAALTGAPSEKLIEQLKAGDTQILTWGIMPSKGGLPIVVDGQMVGAIGASGRANGRDVECSQAGVDAIQRMPAQ